MKTCLAWVMVVGFLAPVDSLDRQAQRWVLDHRTPLARDVMHRVSSACTPVTVSVALVGLAVLGGPVGAQTALVAAAALVPTNLAVELLKRTTNRTRPDGERQRSNASFPSSHAANAFALAVVLARRWRRALIPALLGAVVIASSRVVLNRHFVSDAVAGAALGAAVAWGACRWFERRWPPKPRNSELVVDRSEGVC